MKIIINILEKDQTYLKKIVPALNTRYADKMEIQAFDNGQSALEHAETVKPDLFVFSDLSEVDLKRLPAGCIPVYFSDSNDIESVHGIKAVGKFQKIDTIYKQFLNIYAEEHSDIMLKKSENRQCKCIAFMSPAGGVGTSTVAAAAAQFMAKKGKKAVYLDLNTYGDMDIFFSGEGQLTMGNIIYELKKGNTNLHLKLESVIKQDVTGVCFIQQPKVLLDMLELTEQDKAVLIDELKTELDFEYVILDMAFNLTKKACEIYQHIDQMILVSDGTEISNRKIQRAIEACRIMDLNQLMGLETKIKMVYNRFASRSGQILKNMDMIGGVPVFKAESVNRIVEQISEMEFLEYLM